MGPYAASGPGSQFQNNTLAQPGVYAGPTPYNTDSNWFRQTGNTVPLPGNALGVDITPGSGNRGGNPPPNNQTNVNLNQLKSTDQFNNQPSYEDKVNSEYGGINQVLDKREQDLRAGLPDFLNQVSSAYDPMRPQLDNALQTGQQLGQSQMNDVRSQQQSAIDQAKQMYSQMTQGAQQRFGALGGGINSAADFMNNYLSQQMQQGVQNINQTAGTNMGHVQAYLQNLQTTHDNNIKQLDLQKTSAMNDARAAFQNKLDDINNMRVQAQGDKAKMVLENLQALRQNAQNIENNYRNTLAQLTLQHQAQIGQLQSSVAGYQAYSHQPVNLQGLPGVSFSQTSQPAQNDYLGGGNSIFGAFDPRRQQQGQPTF